MSALVRQLFIRFRVNPNISKPDSDSQKVHKFLATLLLLFCINAVGGCSSGSQSDSADLNIIGQGTLIKDERSSLQFDFTALATALHNITVSWDSGADINFDVFNSSGLSVNSNVVQRSNPVVWTGELIAGNQYSLSVWLAEDRTALNTNVVASIELALIDHVSATGYSDNTDTSAWVLDGPASTLDYQAGDDTSGWGRTLLRVDDVLLVGGDFKRIRQRTSQSISIARPWLAALDAITGQPVTTFKTPDQINSVVRSLALSADGTRVNAGGDFGLVALDAVTGAVDFEVPIISESNAGRVFDIVVTETQLYIGGDFTQIGITPINNLARLSTLGELDSAWNPDVAGGISAGRSAPVLSLALSPTNNTLYVGGTYKSINGTPVVATELDTTVSMLAISTLDGSVNAERFVPELMMGEDSNSKNLLAYDIALLDGYIMIAWGGANYLSLHQADGALLQQYSGQGDVHVIHILDDLVIVGHHGEFFGTLTNPIPPGAVVSINPLELMPFNSIPSEWIQITRA